jgi:hypothetical protein
MGSRQTNAGPARRPPRNISIRQVS